MTRQFYLWLTQQIKSNNEHAFYIRTEWLHVRNVVLHLDNYECQICKENGRYSRAQLVHHISHLKEHPEWALDIWVKNDSGVKERNLISVCKYCHETVCHPERLRKWNKQPDATFPERWD